MKLDKKYLKFPTNLPNDLETFLSYYPYKYPGIVSYYEEVAEKIAGDPQAFREYGNFARDELFAGFDKIKSDYDKGDQDDLDFLVDIDERLNKLTCYRFWIVNYLFPDGPVHDYFVDVLKNSIRKFVDVGEDVEDFEGKIVRIQRDLLQSDYADLYLSQALSGVGLVKQIKDHPGTKEIYEKASVLIKENAIEDANEINKIWDEFVQLIENKDRKDLDGLRESLRIPLAQAVMRSSRLPIYNMLTHAVEFEDENEALMSRHGQMQYRIDQLFQQAKERLTAEEFKFFAVAYQQSRNFTMYKDIMGMIDERLLPLWLGMHNKIKGMLNAPGQTGPAAIFYHQVWYLPNHLKAKVFTPDLTPFNLKTI